MFFQGGGEWGGGWKASKSNKYWRTGEENGERAEISGKVEGSEGNFASLLTLPMIPRAPCFLCLSFSLSPLSFEASNGVKS